MALGRIAYWAAWVEAKLAWVALELMIELGPPRKAIVQGRTAGQVIELCRALLDAGIAEPEGVRDALALAKSALDRRNQILHSAIGGALMSPGEEGLVALWGRKGASRVAHESEFDQVAEELFRASEALSPYV